MPPESNTGLQRQSKVIFPYHFSPDKRLVHIVARISDDPGALASVLTLIGSKVNLIGTTSYALKGGTAIFSGFGELLSRSDTGESVREFVTLSRKVMACQVWESKGGLLVDWFHTGVQSSTGEPCIILPTSGLAKTFDEVVRTFGSGGETILYLQGREFAIARFELYRKMLGPHPEKRFDEALHIFEAAGYGSSSVDIRDSGKELHLVTKGCFECSSGSESGRTCAYTRGLAVGSFGEAFGKELTCEEIRCRLKRSNECEFVLRAKDGQPLVQQVSGQRQRATSGSSK